MVKATESHLQWDHRTLHQIGVATVNLAAEDPGDPEDRAAVEALGEDPTAAMEEISQTLRGGITKGTGKERKERAKAAQEAEGLETEAALVGGRTVQDGARTAHTTTRSGRP